MSEDANTLYTTAEELLTVLELLWETPARGYFTDGMRDSMGEAWDTLIDLKQHSTQEYVKRMTRERLETGD